MVGVYDSPYPLKTIFGGSIFFMGIYPLKLLKSKDFDKVYAESEERKKKYQEEKEKNLIGPSIWWMPTSYN